MAGISSRSRRCVDRNGMALDSETRVDGRERDVQAFARLVDINGKPHLRIEELMLFAPTSNYDPDTVCADLRRRIVTCDP